MNITPWLEISLYDGARLLERGRANCSRSGARVVVGMRSWSVRLTPDSDGVQSAEFQADTGAENAAAGLAWEIDNWSEQVYVLMPAGAYAGNRFPSIRVPYSPRVPEDQVKGVETPPLITDVPRLNLGEGPSRIQLKSGDLAFPAFGWFSARAKRAWFCVAARPESAADWVWEIEESPDRDRAVFRVIAPGVREGMVYRIPMMTTPSPDRAVAWAAGEVRQISVRVLDWPCESLTSFLDRVMTIRSELAGGDDVPAVLPFHAAFQLIEEHYNRDSWREAFGFYATDCNPNSFYAFQTGWCGGMIATLPLLIDGEPLTRARARKTLDTFMEKAPLPCGLFWGKCTREGVWTADFTHDKARPYTHTWTLTRRQADALWYILRHLEYLESAEPGFRVPPAWDRALRAAADVFVGLWRKYGQFGQFLHQHTAEILVGGSTSGALVPAALTAAWRRYKDAVYLDVAREAASAFAQHVAERGYTTGGPGDALQNPDSESCAALVESFAELYDATGEARWLDAGRTAAALLSTWVMPYRFPFPPDTEFGRLGIHTRGSVFANTQNKHSAPGICTHAGAGLFRLFRASGDARLMDLVRDIARFLPQVVSRPGCEIRAKDGRVLPSGWINERVNTSDWDDNLGGVFYGSCWCEVSLLLSAVELPGVYARRDLRRAWALDHVEARWEGDRLVIENSTVYSARVRILVEDESAARRSLSPMWAVTLPAVTIPPKSLTRV